MIPRLLMIVCVVGAAALAIGFVLRVFFQAF